MTNELKIYILHYCRDWMLTEELNALRRISLTAAGELTTRRVALENYKMELIYGFQDEATNLLVNLGAEALETQIAQRILQDYEEEVMNYCPKCEKLTRTPKAKQCRYCKHDWH